LEGKIPMIYACSPELKPLAKRWKQQFNNNSKIPAFWNSIDEIPENEVEGLQNAVLNLNFIPIILNDFAISEKYRTMVSNFKTYLGKLDVDYIDFFVEGESILEKIFSLIYLGDMLTFYLGILNEQNSGKSLYQEYMNEK